ncbi:hypothetical protein C0J52_08411 [Blattella germanica]|nr:hypothetical protein C0J52_08411 [Blattella germanica]
MFQARKRHLLHTHIIVKVFLLIEEEEDLWFVSSIRTTPDCSVQCVCASGFLASSPGKRFLPYKTCKELNLLPHIIATRLNRKTARGS